MKNPFDMLPGSALPPENPARTRHNWFLTFTGKQFYPTDPKAADIDIADIAHSLSNICRFGGHCKQFYSVAQHSVFVSHLVERDAALAGLLHDATEAYCGDLVRPLKIQLPEFCTVERGIAAAIAEKFDIPLESITPDLTPALKLADNIALLTERNNLFPPGGADWCVAAEPLDLLLDFWSPADAESRFLKRFDQLTGRPTNIIQLFGEEEAFPINNDVSSDFYD